MSKFSVYQIFPKILSTSIINIDKEEDKILQDLITKADYYKVGEEQDLPICYASTNKFILNDTKILFLKNYILNEFNKFKNVVLNLNNTQFELTTSWLTKTPKNHFSNFHNHSNCMFSGIFYFDDSSDLLLNDYTIKQFYVIPKSYNDYNADSYTIKPKKNMMVFFDSRLHHRITKNLNEKTRYSLAFNFIPKGHIGIGDSQAVI
tara:strand:+ start:1581 stop:2195 length:615 start_codon:yes stop_codon:yes gene_type:complete